MEITIQRRPITVYGVCPNMGEPIYVGKWERGSAIDRGRVYKEVDYGWWHDCVTLDNILYVFGYSGGMINLDDMRTVKKIPYITAERVASDGKFIYVATSNGLHVFDRSLRLVNLVKARGLRDVAVAEDGTVYVLDQRTLYVYDGSRLRSVYKLDSDALIGYYVLPHGDSIYVSTLNSVVCLDAKTYGVKAFSPRLARTIATVGDLLISLYDNVVAIADSTSLSVLERQYVHGLSSGFAKAHVAVSTVITPVYFKEENAVLTLTP